MEWEIDPHNAKQLAQLAIGEVERIVAPANHVGNTPLRMIIQLDGAIHSAALAVRILEPWIRYVVIKLWS